MNLDLNLLVQDWKIFYYNMFRVIYIIFSSRDYAGKWYPPENEKNIVFRNNDMYCERCLNEEINGNKCIKEVKPYEIIKT